MVSHNMNDIARLADHLLVMHEGEVAFYGTPEDIFTHHGAELREIGLGIHHAQRLANELRDLGFDLPNVLYSPESLADKLVEVLESPSSSEVVKDSVQNTATSVVDKDAALNSDVSVDSAGSVNFEDSVSSARPAGSASFASSTELEDSEDSEDPTDSIHDSSLDEGR